MPLGSPDPMPRLLAASNADERALAWTDFVEVHSGALLYVARSMGGDIDRVMDRYAYMLEALQRDDCQRLRAFLEDGRGTFTTWLIVVARRLCLDHHRHRYGRPQSEGPAALDRHRERRQLTDLVGDELGLARLESPGGTAPDIGVERSDRTNRIQCALAQLDPEDRLILRLRFEDGRSVPDIARLLKLGSPFRLYRRIDRTLNDLRRYLKTLGINDADP